MATLVALAILGFINGIIIPYTVYIGAMVDVFFVNTLGLPVNMGIVVFALALFAVLFYGIFRTHRAGKKMANLLLLATTMILIGFSSYATVTIRAVANPPMNSNNPNNPHALLAVLNRDQYGNRPLLYGPYYSTPVDDVVESTSYHYDSETGRYEQVVQLTDYIYPSEFKHFFPRLWNSMKGEAAYKPWAAYRTKVDVLRDENGEVIRDENGQAMRGEVLDFGRTVYDSVTGENFIEPTFGENLYYFRKYEHITIKGCVYATLVALAILGFINGIIIPYTVYIGAMVDLFFVNTLGLPVNLGITVFALTVFAALFYGMFRTHKAGKKVLNLILVSTTMILIGFSSYATVTIRAAANPPMNSNNPNNPHALLSVLNRDQYGNRPLLYGPYYSSPVEDYIEKTSYYYNADTKQYDKVTSLTGYKYPSEFMHFFPRLWNSFKGEKEYKPWAAYRTKTDVLRDEYGEIIRDESGRAVTGDVLDFGRTVYDQATGESFVEPTFGENLYYFFTYQLNYMYWRYFLWNFVGRQDDIQASGETIAHGNWMSGIDALDEAYLGPQSNLPSEMADNPARNTYYFLPFILGLIGLIYQLNRDQRNFIVVMWLFVMMGIALVVYFNTCPSEPRERDYVYAGSFYAFCIWIGLGVLALRDAAEKILKRDNRTAAITATVVCLCVPTILAAENWDDHDRSGRTMARDIGWNYLHSTPENAIVINYGDNDTFPLWFNQEVDGVRTDVRIMNSSYLGGEWYIDEMKTRANEAAPVPFKLPANKYTFVNDVVPIREKVNRTVDIKEIMSFIESEQQGTKLQLTDGSLLDYLPARRIAIPVNKENAIKSGIVKEKDSHLIVDTVYINIAAHKNRLDKSEMMMLDLLANFEWNRPICFTQVYILQDFGLLDYLQFDGYSYRLVPIYTPYKSAWDIGRIDTEWTAPLLMEKFRFGNLADPDVLVDHFTQYNLSASKAR
ncbi:MAG: hypothetical protein II217_04530, partial [Alistipes sp.]|nr:hypothetical protein [Alistipes sp.]